MQHLRGYAFEMPINTVQFQRDGDTEARFAETSGRLRLWSAATEEEMARLAAGVDDTLSLGVQLSLFGADVPGAETGAFDLQVENTGRATRRDDVWEFEVELPEARLLYQAHVDERGFDRLGRDTFVTEPDLFAGSITGMIRPPEFGVEKPEIELFQVRLDLSPANAGPVTNIVIELEAMKMSTFFSSTEQDATQYPCDQVQTGQPRRLPVQFVFFENTSAVRNLAADQLGAAQTVWSHACITFDDTAAAKVLSPLGPAQTSDAEAIAGKHKPVAGVVPIFLVRNDLAGYGGGVCLNPGTALAKVIISANVSQIVDGEVVINRWLLAHELGHVLSGYHPGEPPTAGWWHAGVDPLPMWEGDASTVLVPSGAAANPVSDANTVNNCWHAWNTSNPAVVAM